MTVIGTYSSKLDTVYIIVLLLYIGVEGTIATQRFNLNAAQI